MRQFRFPLIVFLILVATMFACGNSPEEDSASVRVLPTLRPTFTPTPLPPTDTPVLPTDTPIPPTDTPLPTETPIPPTATPLPTDTPVPPTDTPRPTQPTRPPTNTPLPPTATPVPFLLKDSFDGGLQSGWKPFLNYWRLEEGQWAWSGDAGINGSGCLVQNCCANGGRGEDALMMYLGDGAESWTDYRLEVQLMVPTDKSQLQGIWFRGQYEETTNSGQWVTGYYVMIGRERTVRLLQLQTGDDCRGGACDNPQNQYAFHNPYILRDEEVAGVDLARWEWHTLAVEVRGNQIKIWVDGVFAFDYVDDHYPFLQGTVGFKTYRARPVLYDNLLVTPLK
jgi:hypothetical protein